MKKIIDIYGKEHNVECIACSIQSGEVTIPIERIAETKNFVVEQDLEWPIEGFLVIVSRKHINSVDELNEQEMNEFAQLLRKIRVILRKLLGISDVTLVQEEHSKTSHFHLWLFPWHSWMQGRWNGKIAEIKDIMQYSKKEMSGDENLGKIRKSAEKLRKEL